MQEGLTQFLKDLISADKKLWRFFVGFFVAALLIFNWNKLYWIFDQRAISGIIESKLVKDIDTKTADDLPKVDAVVNNPIPVATTALPTKPKIASVPEKPVMDSIYISALNSRAPILKSATNTNTAYLATLKKGVLHYLDSASPNEMGAVIILGHSAPPNWPNINYDNVFSSISSLKAGDEIKVIYKGKTYVYLVDSGQVIDKGGDIPEKWLAKDGQRIILLSCWPPGKDYKRYGVMGKLLTE